MIVTEGEVVLTPLPQADGQTKTRPAIVLRVMPSFGNILVCGLSTQLHQEVTDFDEVISSAESDFAASGLRSSSVIQLGFLALRSPLDIAIVIGAISTERHARLLRRLSAYLTQHLSS